MEICEFGFSDDEQEHHWKSDAVFLLASFARFKAETPSSQKPGPRVSAELLACGARQVDGLPANV